MYFFAGLIAFYGLFWLLGIAGVSIFATTHIQGTYAVGIMFILAGLLHFIRPKEFIRMMPKGIWNKEMTNWAIGIAEIGLGAALFLEQYRTMAAYGLIGLLILVFPANLILANNKSKPYNVARLFFQPVFIFWIYWFCLYHTW